MTTPNALVDDSRVPRSDEELVSAARDGDDVAYAELWTRHVDAGRRAARAVSPSVDPDDLVSEAFTSILAAIRSGGGPREGFRPYLFSAIRNTAASWGRRASEQPLDDLDDRVPEVGDDIAELVADRSVLAHAFRGLPERWRTLLWYIEVEGMKPREVAPLLGMTPNAVSALAHRARDGFRQAWLQAHVNDPRRPAECRWVCELLVANQSRKSVRRGDRHRLEAHLQECQACRIVAADIEDVAQKLRMILLPLVLGGAGAVAYTADATPAVASALTGAADWGGTSGTGEGGAGGAAGGGAGAGATGTTALAVVGIAAGAVLAVAAAAAAVVIAVGPWNSTAAGDPPIASRDSPMAELDSGNVTDPEGDEAAASAVAEPAPGTIPVLEPVEPADPVRLVEPVRTPRTDTATPAPPPTTPAPAPTPTTPPPTPSPAPTPAPSPPPRTAAPILDTSLDTSAPIPEAIAGTGVPGALVQLFDETGVEVARTAAGGDGAFRVDIPADALREGMTVRAVQTSRDLLPSEPSAAVGPFALPAPTVTGDNGTLEAELVDADFDGAADDLSLLLDGIAGETVKVSIDGVATGNLHVLTREPLRRVVYNMTPGDHVIGIRYVDPGTGRVGRLASVTIVAVAPAV